MRVAALVPLMALSLGGCKERERKLPVRPLVNSPVVQQPAEPAPEPPKLDTASILFPHHAGDTWELSATSDGLTYGITMTVKDVTTEASGRVTFTVETKRGGEVAQREVYLMDEKGVFRTASGAEELLKIAPPLPVLTFPWQLGKSWKWKGKIGGGDQDDAPAEAEFTLSGPEELDTPAKKFVEVYKLNQTYKLTTAEGEQTWRNTQWLAPNVGLVKQETDVAGQRTVALLAKYTVAPPGDKPAEDKKTP
jgi:hypothetical protein